ncbi:hypothetical protein BDR07DRAFT_1461880 [Suillus spraguei]|nr:hypothetical protein BDR07DRAFT_1461880 [Suillus spraguei]
MTLWRYIVLTFSIVTILTIYVLMVIIPCWRSPNWYPIAAVILVYSVFMPASSIFPSRATGNSYFSPLIAMLDMIYAYHGLPQTHKGPLLQHIQYKFLTFVGVMLIIEIAYDIYMEEGDLKGGPLKKGSLDVVISEVENPRHISTVEKITPDQESHPK